MPGEGLGRDYHRRLGEHLLFDGVPRRFPKLATVTARDGRITFSTRQMGNMVITTGTI